ncbi:MAG: CDP-diacylglycerol--serine O-phosphatidyltransferase [Chloroflexota bacterium]
MKREWLPNLFTLGNLATGFTSLLFVFHSQFELAAVAILVAGLLDGLDGRVARLLGVTSPMGQELDSLADVVSFGVAPGLLLYALDLQYLGVFGAVLAAFFAACAGLRLARFNVGTPNGYFVGLPSTAAGGIVASFVLYGAKLRSPFYPVLALALAVLMVSRLRYRDFKRINLTELRFSKLFLVLAVTSGVALIDLRKLIFLPLVAYLLYGPKDSWLAARAATRQISGQINTQEA